MIPPPAEDTYYEVAPRERLRPNPNNPKAITEADIAKMVTYLQAHGFRDPIEARHEDGLVLAGHRRLLAADRLGLTHIPTNFHVGMSDAQAAAYTIAHSRSEKDVKWNRALLSDQMAGMDEDTLGGLGFDATEIAGLFDLDRGVDPEEEPAGREGDDRAAPSLQPGELWIIGPCTFQVYENLDIQGIAKAEALIRKIAKLLKQPALLDGDDSQPLDAVLAERSRGI